MKDKSIQVYINAQRELIQERASLVAQIADIDKVLGGRGAAATLAAPKSANPRPAKKATKTKRTMSPEARAKISAAAKKRWAKVKRKK